MKIISSNISQKDLKKLLKTHDIPYGTKWGRRLAKSVQDLLCAIHRKKCRLIVYEGKLYCWEPMVIVEVYHRLTDTAWQRLQEKRRILPNRKVKNFDPRLYRGVTKKIAYREKPIQAAKRGIKEELGFKSVPTLYFIKQGPYKNFNSRSYPGLPFLRVIYRFGCIVSSVKQYNYDGYQYPHPKANGQPQGTINEYVWVPIISEYVPDVLPK